MLFMCYFSKSSLKCVEMCFVFVFFGGGMLAPSVWQQARSRERVIWKKSSGEGFFSPSLCGPFAIVLLTLGGGTGNCAGNPPTVTRLCS